MDPQCARGFLILALVFGKIANPFFIKNVVPAAKYVGVDSLELRQKIQTFLRVEKNSNQQQRRWED